MYRYLALIPLPHLPKFSYMSRLSVTLGVSDLQFLPTFLESCPNLKSLIMVMLLVNPIELYSFAYHFLLSLLYVSLFVILRNLIVTLRGCF